MISINRNVSGAIETDWRNSSLIFFTVRCGLGSDFKGLVSERIMEKFKSYILYREAWVRFRF